MARVTPKPLVLEIDEGKQIEQISKVDRRGLEPSIFIPGSSFFWCLEVWFQERKPTRTCGPWNGH